MSDPSLTTPEFHELLDTLAAEADALEGGDCPWPAGQLERLSSAGVLGWVIPPEYGGAGVSARFLNEGYVQLASSCLTTAFVLTQRNGATQRIAGSANSDLKSELLPPLCTSEMFATVGVSHLTTSRQHLRRPVLQVEQRDGKFVFDGFAPWVTGAAAADVIVTGGTLSDGTQILAAVPTDLPGLTVDPPPRLLALNASQTSSVRFDNVAVEERRVLAGPTAGVMKQGTGGGTGSLTTSALAVGASLGTLRRLQREAERRPDLEAICRPLQEEYDALQEDLLAASDPQTAGSLTAAGIRARANSLVLRMAQAYLTAAKGAGFIAGHPAERALREAAFFLVWSCPQPVQTAALREFACVLES